MPTPTELARQFRDAVNKQDAAALARLARAYSELYKRMQGKLDSFLLAVGNLENPTKGQVMRLAQYKNLISAIESELTKYSAFVEVEIRTNAQTAVELAVSQANAFLKAAGYAMPKSLNTTAIYNMLGFLQEDSPLFARLSKLAGENAGKVANALLEGISFGYNPSKTARLFEQYMGGGLTDAMRMTRTSQLYATREASRASYNANSDVVTGWEWISSLDSDVCMACAIEHGTIHPLDEPMNSHYNCRCTSVPIIVGYSDRDQLGADWFKELSESRQREMMGGKTYDAWKSGAFNLEDMVTRRHDDVYGEMLAVMPLQDLIQE